MRAAAALLALLLAGCLVPADPSASPSTSPTSTSGAPATPTATASPTATPTSTVTHAATEQARLPMLRANRSFEPAEGRFMAGQAEHCPTISRLQDGHWTMRLSPTTPTPAAGLRETWDFSAVKWVSAFGSARGTALQPGAEVPLLATFGSATFGTLTVSGAQFLLDGKPLQSGASHRVSYDAVDQDGKTVRVTESIAFEAFPDAAVTVQRPSSYGCV